jgi:hypothetical protein
VRPGPPPGPFPVPNWTSQRLRDSQRRTGRRRSGQLLAQPLSCLAATSASLSSWATAHQRNLSIRPYEYARRLGTSAKRLCITRTCDGVPVDLNGRVPGRRAYACLLSLGIFDDVRLSGVTAVVQSRLLAQQRTNGVLAVAGRGSIVILLPKSD